MIVYLARYVDLPMEPMLPPSLRYRLELCCRGSPSECCRLALPGLPALDTWGECPMAIGQPVLLPAQMPVLEVEAAPQGGVAPLDVLLPVTDIVTEGHVLLGV